MEKNNNEMMIKKNKGDEEGKNNTITTNLQFVILIVRYEYRL